MAARVPEREDIDPLVLQDHAVEEVVPNSREMNASHARKGDVPRASTAVGLECHQYSRALELFADRVRRLGSILPPPLLRGANLRLLQGR